MTGTVSFTQMKDGTKEDYALLRELEEFPARQRFFATRLALGVAMGEAMRMGPAAIAARLAELKAMQSIGYRHMLAYLQRETDWEETLRLLKRDTRRYAKRQLTWFRADPEMVWIAPDQAESLQPDLESFLTTGQPIINTQRGANGNV